MVNWIKTVCFMKAWVHCLFRVRVLPLGSVLQRSPLARVLLQVLQLPEVSGRSAFRVQEREDLLLWLPRQQFRSQVRRVRRAFPWRWESLAIFECQKFVVLLSERDRFCYFPYRFPIYMLRSAGDVHHVTFNLHVTCFMCARHRTATVTKIDCNISFTPVK